MRLLKVCLALTLLLVAHNTAMAADVKTITGPKGSEVWFVEDRTVPIIALSAAIPAGSSYEPHGKAGLATFAAALLDEGSGKMNASAFQTALADKAIRISASPSRDYTVITLLTLTTHAPDAFRLLGQALSHPRFDEDAIARIRLQMLEALKQDTQEPNTVASKAFNKIFFAGHPYGNPVSGDSQSVQSITRDDLNNFARRHWVRNGLKISVSGDIDEATLKTLLNTAFGALPNTAPHAQANIRRMGAPGVHLESMPVPQPAIAFGLPGLLRHDKDFMPAYIANYILGGGGFASDLTKEVREKRGLTYGISTSLATYRKAGVFAGQVATKAENVPQTIEVVRKVIGDFAAKGPSAAQLADAKTYLTGSFPLSFDSNIGIAAQLNAFQRNGLSADYVAKRNALIEAVTLEDVKRVAKKLFDPSKLTIVVAGDFPQP